MDSTIARSLWLETKFRNPALNADVEADVAIVGAGITGLAAYQLAKKGLKAIVFERQTVGAGATFHATAHLTARPDVSAGELIERSRDQARGCLPLVW